MASEISVGCVLLKEGKAKPFIRGTKSKVLPEWDRDRCVKCGVCYLFCPDAAITKVDEGYFDVSREYCKGCGICQQECWFGAISMAEEV